MKAIFLNEECDVKFHNYSNGRIAIQLVIAEPPHEPMAVATLNIPSEPMAPDEVIIKDYSENAGMVDALIKAGVIYHPHRYVSSGWVSKIPVCGLTSTATKEISKSA